MGEYSKYPNSIDTTTELPKATNLITPVNSEFVNRLRDAIVCIETELGAQPSGTFSTTRARLDAIDVAFRSLGTEVSDIDPTIEIFEEAISINANANSINFTGNVAVTNTGDGVSVEIIGGQATQIQETFIATDGQTLFTLSETPFQINGVHMYVNGIKMRYVADYIIVGTAVTYLDDIALVAGDEVEFWYLVDSAGLVATGLVSGSFYLATSAITKVELFTSSDIVAGNPISFRGSVAGWPVSGSGQYVDFFFNAENVAGVVSIIGLAVTPSGATLGTITFEVSGLTVIVYVEPAGPTAYTWRCAITEEK